MRICVTTKLSGEPDQVFTWIDNPEKAMLWQKGVKKGEITQETPEKIGTTFIEEMEEDGNRLEIRGVITGYSKNKMIAFHLESKIHKLDVIYSIKGENGNSVITVESNIHWQFPMSLVSLILGRRIKAGIVKQTEAEFAELKRLCEEEKASKDSRWQNQISGAAS